jgi:vitamin B12 transporter
MKKIIKTSIATALLIATSSHSSSNIEDLGAITISSVTKSEQSLQNVTANVEVISNAKLEEQHVKNVGEALTRVAGISLGSNGGVGQLDTLYIRGIESKRILILIDGIRYNEPTSTSGAPLAQLMIDDVEKIEIVKGAQSGIWGADASGGVINIITKKAKNGVHGSILTETGSYNTKKYAGSLSAKTDKFFVNVNASKFSTSGFSAFEARKGSANYGKRGDELGLEDDGYKNKTYTVNAGVNITDNDSITALYKNIDSEYEYDNTSSDNLTNEAFINHYFKALNYTHKTDIYSLRVSASQSKFDREQGTTHAKGKVNEFSVLNQINYLENDTFTIGVNKQNFEDITNKTKYQITALFASNLNKFDKLIISETIRYDDNNKFEEKITGKLGARYNFHKDLYLSANYGTAYNAPTLANLGYTPTLEPETTKSLDASIYLYGFKATYFESKIKNMIDFDFSPSFHYFNEEGTTVLKGYEFEYEKNILEDLLLTLNYTRLSAKNDDGEDKRRRPEETVNIGLNYYGIDKLHLGLNTEFVGKRYNSDDNSGAQTGRYTVSNVVINYDLRKDIKVYGKIDNITDRYYQTIDGYATSARAYYAGLKYSF